MQIYNDINISDEIFKSIEKYFYKRDKIKDDFDYSITELIDSPRIVQLRRRYDSEISVPVSSLFPSWYGNVIHDTLQSIRTSKRVNEVINGKLISGEYDYFHKGVLKDYKTTSVWKYILGDLSSWSTQLNCYSYFLRDKKVDKLFIEAFFLDWNNNESLRIGNYPKAPQLKIPIYKMLDEYVFYYLVVRIDEHEKNVVFYDEELSDCTSEEMWEKNATFAVKKEGQKKALRVLSSLEEAEEWADRKMREKKDNLFIEERPGERVRCERFCQVKDFCNQYREYKNGST